MSIGYVIFAIFAIAIVQMHYRGSVRFPWSRQVLTHTNYLAPYNLLMDLFSKMPNRPILDVEDMDDLKFLRENWQTIRDEAIQLSAAGDISAADKLNDLGFNSFFRTGWTRFYLKWYDDYLPSANHKCPKTIALLKQTPSINAAMFACLPAGAVLTQHRDPYAGAYRYHLGLQTPNSDDCYILIDGRRHVWHDGEDVLFDETFIHEAHNDTDQQRIIFFADVHRAMRYKWVDNLNHWVSDHIIKGASSSNDASEEVGLLNKAFEKLYSIRTFSRKIKHWNRTFYYALKYTLFFGAIYLIFF